MPPATHLIFAEENYRFWRPFGTKTRWISLEAGHREPKLIAKAEEGDPTARAILGMLRRMIVHQFHNTSSTARVRSKWDVSDGRWLKEDAGNLAPFLYRLQQQEPPYYRRIVDIIRSILPFFADFELEPDVVGCYCSGGNGTPTWFSAPPRPPTAWSG